MNRRGIGSVVSYVLLTLLAVVGVSVFLGVYLGNVEKSTSGDSTSCLNIDLKVTECTIFTPAIIQAAGLPDTGSGLFAVVERLPGGKEISDLKVLITDSNGLVHSEEPVALRVLRYDIQNDYSNFVEYSSADAAVRDIQYTPVSVAISAVVGDTICPPSREFFSCEIYVP